MENTLHSNFLSDTISDSKWNVFQTREKETQNPPYDFGILTVAMSGISMHENKFYEEWNLIIC